MRSHDPFFKYPWTRLLFFAHPLLAFVLLSFSHSFPTNPSLPFTQSITQTSMTDNLPSMADADSCLSDSQLEVTQPTANTTRQWNRPLLSPVRNKEITDAQTMDTNENKRILTSPVPTWSIDFTIGFEEAVYSRGRVCHRADPLQLRMGSHQEQEQTGTNPGCTSPYWYVSFMSLFACAKTKVDENITSLILLNTICNWTNSYHACF